MCTDPGEPHKGGLVRKTVGTLSPSLFRHLVGQTLVVRLQMDPFRQLLDSICARPGMYVGRNSLVDVSHYLAGYCHGLDDASSGLKPLDGWMRWTEMRFVIRSSAWHWARILLHVYGDDSACFDAFPALYDQFIADRVRLGTDGIETEANRRLTEKYGHDWGYPNETHTSPIS